jgi:manganese/zinc/iron transport system permease protein
MSCLHRFILTAACLLATTAAVEAGLTHESDHAHTASSDNSLTDHRLTWPTAEKLRRVLSLQDGTTRVVVAGVTLLGLTSGLVGTFLLLRKRSLTADALSHATLPGVAFGFLIAVWMGTDGRNALALIGGAAFFGVLGMGTILAIRHTTRIKDDAALGIVLSVFFGLGTILLKVAIDAPGGRAAGLNHYIFGQAASMLRAEAQAILYATMVISLISLALFKEFKLLCFDQAFAATQGKPVLALDAMLMGLVVAVTVIGLRTVGIVLIVALLIVPAAAARFWTERLSVMVLIAAGIGTLGGYFGAIASALWSRLPTGPVIVLICGVCFAISMIFGVRRGVVSRAVRHIRLTRRTNLQHLLRAMFELAESSDDPISFEQIVAKRSWSPRYLRRVVDRARRQGLVRRSATGGFALTNQGRTDAQRVVRNHRLWEVYLITHADIAPSHVDRDADQIEHVLNTDLIHRLETLLAERFPHLVLPSSPHGLPSASTPSEASP